MAYFPRNTVSVDAYGAKGDGVTSDATAISAAVTAGTSGIVTFTPGKTYIMSGALALPNYTYLQGYGATIKAPTQADYQFITLYNKTGCRIEGLTFDGSWTNAASANNAMVDLYLAANVDIRDCTFKNVSSECIRLIGGCTRVNISDNRFTGFAAGVFADDSDGAAATDITVSRNQFHGANSAAAGTAAIKFAGLATNNMDSHAGIVITDNTIVSPGEMGIELQTWFNDSVVSNNDITQATYGISVDGCARVALNGNVARGCDYLGIEATNCSEVAINGCVVDGTTGAGIAATDEGLLINVSSGVSIAGTVVRNVINRNIYMLSSKGVTVAGSTIKVGVASSNGIAIKNTTDVNLNGNTLWSPLATTQDMIGLDSTDTIVARVNITNNTFLGTMGRFGIFVMGSTNPVEDVYIANNFTAGMYATQGMYTNQMYNGATNRRIRLQNNFSSGSQDFNNAINIPVWSGASNLILDERYGTVLIDATAAQRIVTLPTAANCNGLGFTVVKYDASANAVQLISSGSQLINTQTGQVLTTTKARMSVVSDGFNWAITQSGAS